MILPDLVFFCPILTGRNTVSVDRTAPDGTSSNKADRPHCRAASKRLLQWLGCRRSKVIHNRINSCITNKIRIRIFVDNTDQILFRIPAVTENNDMFPALKFRHDFTDHGGSKFQFGFFFLPHTVSKRNGKIRDLILIPHRYAKHDTYKTVSIQIVRTVLCSMVKQF